MNDCTHHWTTTSECPMCLRAEIERLREEREATIDVAAQLVVERDEMRALLAEIAEGLETVRYPVEGAGRQWEDELGVYLRGQAGAVLLVAPDTMRALEAYAHEEEE